MSLSESALKRLGATFLGLSLLLAAVFAWLVWGGDRYTIYADGRPIVVRGRYETVGEVVTAAGLTLRPEDWLQPPATAAASPEMAIAYRPAREVLLRTTSLEEHHLSSQTTLGGFLQEIAYPLQRTTQISADGALVSVYDIGRHPLPAVVEIGQFLSVTVHDGRQVIDLRTARQTVGEALQEAGLELYATDGVEPPAGSWLEPGMVITVRRARPLSIWADGQVLQTRSFRATVAEVLAENGIGLAGFDYTRPGLEEAVGPATTIEVIRVTEDFRTIDEEIPYESFLQGADQLEIDQRAVLQAGIPGLKRTRLRIRYEDGVEVGRQADGEWVVREPQPEIVGFGTRVEIRTVETPEGPLEYWRVVRMRVTAYTPASSGKPRSSPSYGITASGVKAGYGVVAVDPRVVPFRSYVYVPGYGRAFAGDTGGGVKGRWIDLGYPDGGIKAWNGYVDVFYLTPVPDEIDYIIPSVLP